MPNRREMFASLASRTFLSTAALFAEGGRADIAALDLPGQNGKEIASECLELVFL